MNASSKAFAFLLPLLLAGVPSLFCSCISSAPEDDGISTLKDNQWSPNTHKSGHKPDYTSDIEFGDAVTGSATRYQLFGFINWGDNDYSHLENLDHEWLIANKTRMGKKAYSAAAYNAMGGDPQKLILSPQLTVNETNLFYLFRRHKATVHGRSAKRYNFRQVKKFSTDNAETLLLDQEYRLFRDGNETIRISATNNLRPRVADTIRVIERAKNPVKKLEVLRSNPPSPEQIQPPQIIQPPHITNSIQFFNRFEDPVKEVEALQSPQPSPLIQPEAAALQFKHPVIQNVLQRQRYRKLYLLNRSD
jgi:hypothetical protein